MNAKHVIAIVFSIIGIIAGRYAYQAFFGQSDTVSFEDSDWSRVQYLGITFDAPFELTPMEVPLPANVKQYVKEMKTYKYETKALGFFISRAEYQGGITPNIDGAVDGAMRNIQATKGVTDFTYTVANNDKNSMAGRLITGTCKVDKKDAEFIAHIYLKDLKLLQIMSMNLKHPENREIRDRIIKSLTISL